MVQKQLVDTLLTLDLEIGKLGVKTQLLDDTGILATGELRIILGLGSGNNHLATKKKTMLVM